MSDHIEGREGAIQLVLSLAVAAIVVVIVVVLVLARFPLDRLPHEQEKGGHSGRSEQVDNSGKGSRGD